jgi:hypothetical protein
VSGDFLVFLCVVGCKGLMIFSKSEIVDVVLDPLLSAKMRKHQKEGVKVSMPPMYGCCGD